MVRSVVEGLNALLKCKGRKGSDSTFVGGRSHSRLSDILWRHMALFLEVGSTYWISDGMLQCTNTLVAFLDGLI